MTIGLICAIPEELTHLREILGGVTTEMVGHAEFATGTLDGHEVVLAGSGIGKAADAEKMYIESILPQKLDYYLQYARSYTLWGDVQIILATLLKIVSR